MVDLAVHDAVEPFMAAVSPRGREELLEEVRRSDEEPQLHGRFVLEVEGEQAGTLAFDVANRRSRIAYLHAIMLDPDYRGAAWPRRRPGSSSGTSSSTSTTTGAARGVRIQRARPPSFRTRWLPARGRAPAGVLAARRLGRRDPLRARPRGSRARSLAAALLALFGHRCKGERLFV